MKPIKVHVVEFGDRPAFQMQWQDPTTRLRKTRTTGVKRGDRKTRRAAERVAGEFERQLNNGEHRPRTQIGWEEFCDRYNMEVLSGRAPNTAKRVGTTITLVNRIIGPRYLQELNADTLSQWKARLAREGRRPATVGVYVRHLKAMLGWAKEMEFIADVPKIKPPKCEEAKARAVTPEEFERILAAVDRTARDGSGPMWRGFVEGLWWSGLRLSEAVALSWDTAEPVCAVLRPDYHPVLRFQAKGHKSRRAELMPCAPEFAEILQAVPEGERVGPVFGLPVRGLDRVGRIVSSFGREAGVIVDEESGKAATAHDLRRSFGTRWASRVMPVDLKAMMRHKNIETTLKYYVDQTAEGVADRIWEAYRRESKE